MAAPFRVVVVLLLVLPLDTRSIHGDRGHEAFGLVTTATEAGLQVGKRESVYKLPSQSAAPF